MKTELVTAAVWLLSVGASPAPIAQPPAVACQYEDILESNGKAVLEGSWWLLRDGGRIEIRSADGEHGELWARDGSSISHTRLDHRERLAIDYSSGDLRLLGTDPEQLWYWTSPLPTSRSEDVVAGRIRQRQLDCQPLDASPVALTGEEVLSTYRRVDFIDIGDMASDAQLRWALGTVHGH